MQNRPPLYKDAADHLLFARILRPNVNNTNGMGISRTAKKPRTLDAHSVPSLPNMVPANKGNTPANALLRNVFAATALADVVGKVSIR